MLNRVIQDIHHLRRVHAIFPDAVLGDTLKNKLLRLSLQPPLQQLKLQNQHAYALASAGEAPLHTSAALSSRSSGAVIPPASYAIDPSALCSLLDCLAYFHLGSSAVASEAMQLVQLSAPTMSIPQLCTTLAACCALGAQTDITVTALPLLRTALDTYTAVPSLPWRPSDWLSPPSSSPATAPSSNPAALLFSQGSTVLLLMDSLQRAGVEDVEVWHLLAEHCLQHLDFFDGKQLCSLIGILCAEGINDYPDFFVAAERHIASQPPNFLSPDQILKVVQYYKELQQPVVSLLASANGASQHGEDLERCMNAAASAVAALPGGGSLPSTTSTCGTALHPSLEAFEMSVAAALTSADAQAVLELLQKCEQRRLMTARTMNAILERLLNLHYPEMQRGAFSATAGDTTAPPSGPTRKSVADASPHPAKQRTSMELHLLTQSLLTILSFNDASLFALQIPIKIKADQAKGATAATAMPAVTMLLDGLAEELPQWYHHRVLELVPYALRLLPTASQPRTFFRGVVDHLRRSNDVSSHEGPRQLRHLIEALLALRHYGGESLLVDYMPAITVAVLNTPRSAQLELTALLAHLPCAKTGLIPGVYRQWTSQKRWLRTITEAEVDDALQIMLHSGGVRDSHLLHAVREYVQTQQAHLPPHRVVDYLHQLARLGVRDVEFFTQTAEQLMRRAVEPSLCSSLSSSRGGGTARRGVNSPAAASSPPPTEGATRHQQRQVTTVHDLAVLLFTFTFVLRESIRVTQQIIARLKMGTSVATPRDISLTLYSFVKLRVTRSNEVIEQLCERACETLPQFEAKELASMWSSLRCLRHPNMGLRRRTFDILEAQSTAANCEDKHAAAMPRQGPLRFSDHDCISLGSALLLTEAPILPPDQFLVQRGAAAGATEVIKTASNLALSSFVTLPRGATEDVLPLPLPPAFEHHYVAVCNRVLPAATGQLLYLILCSLSNCQGDLNWTAPFWESVLTIVDKHAESFSTGIAGESEGMAQLEVLAALRSLRRRISDQEALVHLEKARYTTSVLPSASKKTTAAVAAACSSSPPSSWVTPYCPPALWAVLRPLWRDLTRTDAVQGRAHLMAVVSEVRSGAAALTTESSAKIARSAAARKKSASGRGRPPR